MKYDLLLLKQRLECMRIPDGGMIMIALICELLDRLLSQEEIDEILKKYGIKK